MKKTNVVIAVLSLSLGVLLTSCDTAKRAVATSAAKTVKMEDPYVGSWDYIVKDTPNGDVEGVLVIKKEMDTYSALISGEAGELDLSGFAIEDNALEGTFDYQGYEVTVKGTFSGKMIKGDMGVEYMTFPMEAVKQEVAGK